MEHRAQKTSASKPQLGADGIEDSPSRRGNPIDLKVLVHDQEEIKISRGGFRSDKATPDEDPMQLSGRAREIQERPKPAREPYAPRR